MNEVDWKSRAELAEAQVAAVRATIRSLSEGARELNRSPHLVEVGEASGVIRAIFQVARALGDAP